MQHRRIVRAEVGDGGDLALMGNTFVIKAHVTDDDELPFQRVGLLHTTYIYRDPRDAMLSRSTSVNAPFKKGRPNAFSHLTDFDKKVRVHHGLRPHLGEVDERKECAYCALRRLAHELR
ncbi:MAG: hypothetical protein U0X93_05850 [Anaerolineales bacterium]